MDGLNNLDSYTQEIAAAANILGNYLRNSEGASSTTSIIPHLSLPSDAPAEAHRARRNVLANLAKIHTLLTEPTDFLQQLSGQVSPSTLRRILNCTIHRRSSYL